MALVDYIESVLPGWMRRKNRAHWVALAESVALLKDILIEGLIEGRIASMPGQTDAPNLGGFMSVDALPYIARDRRIPAGPLEPPWMHAQRLRLFRPIHRLAGIPAGTLGQLQAIFRPEPPMVRVVWGTATFGNWWTREAGEGALRQTRTDGRGLVFAATDPAGTPIFPSAPDVTTGHAWNWGGPRRYIWPIIYAPNALIGPGYKWGQAGLKWGQKGKTWGTSATPETIELIRSTLDTFRTCGRPVAKIIIAFDPASFNPAAPPGSPGFPDDGDWMLGSKIITVNGKKRRVSTRLASARYWAGTRL